MVKRLKHKNLKLIAIIIVLLLLFSLGGCGIYNVITGSKDKENNLKIDEIKNDDNNDVNNKEEETDSEVVPPNEEENNNEESETGNTSSNDNNESNNNNENNNTNEDTYMDTDDVPTEERKLFLYKGNSNVNEQFDVMNMLPGDSVKNNYQIKVKHKDKIELYFKVDIKRQTNELSEILNIKIVNLNNEEILYNGKIKDIKEHFILLNIDKNNNNETITDIEITVSLPTTAGNKYQSSLLNADFTWYVLNEDVLIPPVTILGVDITIFISLTVIGLILIVVMSKIKGVTYEK